MQGAREYAGLFKTGQYGRFYITSREHARGKTFHIQLLPEGEKAQSNYGNMCLNKDAVLIYGVVTGNPGWTESYGWLHNGPWVKDFEALATSFRMAKEAEREKETARCAQAEEERKAREKALLEAPYNGIGYVREGES